MILDESSGVEEDITSDEFSGFKASKLFLLKAQIHDRIKREKSTKYPTDPQAATAEH
jgi:hypothetical protein